MTTYVTGFAKTILNSTSIKLQYKPFKKHVKLYYLTSVLIVLYISQLNKLVMKKNWVPSCLPSHEESKYVISFHIFLYIVVTIVCLHPIKNAFFHC